MSYEIRSPYTLPLPVMGTVTFYYQTEEELLEEMKKCVKELEEHLNEPKAYVVHKDCPC